MNQEQTKRTILLNFPIWSLRANNSKYNADQIISSKSLEKESKLGPINKYTN